MTKRRLAGLALLGGLAVLALPYLLHPPAARAALQVPPPAMDEIALPQSAPQTAILAGGCFWGMEMVFQHVKGVKRVVVGYTGGAADTAQYETVSTGTTGHAESVQITFDPAVISYGKILQIFFAVAHDPTTLDAQGPDQGTQYRSAIFAMNPAQAGIAKSYIAQLNQSHVFPAPIVTEIDPAKPFYPAEAYHQDYGQLHPDSPYIAFNDAPKVSDLKSSFPAFYRADPVMTAK
jgi:peptide-methionine (S)-S-oxide reductase